MKAKVRPVIIISREDPDPPRKITVFVPISEQNRGSPYEVELPKLPFLTPGSTANAQGILSGPTADKTLFLQKLGDIPQDALKKVEQALLFAMGIA